MSAELTAGPQASRVGYGTISYSLPGWNICLVKNGLR